MEKNYTSLRTKSLYCYQQKREKTSPASQMEIDSSQGIHIDARKQIISQSAHQPTRQQKRETISPTKSHIIQEQKAPLQIVQ